MTGCSRVPVTEAGAGNIIAMSGIGDITIGDTICARGAVEARAVRKDQRADCGDDLLRQRQPLRRVARASSSPPARSATASMRETLKDVSLRVSEMSPTAPTASTCAGRGEMSLSILIETMRREGYEFQVVAPARALSGDRRQEVRAYRARRRRRARRTPWARSWKSSAPARASSLR